MNELLILTAKYLIIVFQEQNVRKIFRCFKHSLVPTCIFLANI